MDDLISVNELRSHINDEVSPLLIDVRAPEAYEKGHLPGAINIPSDQISGSMAMLPTDRPVVTYCNMHNPGNSGSENAADTLSEAGFHARALKGGFPEWEEAGYPIDRMAHTLPRDPTSTRRA